MLLTTLLVTVLAAMLRLLALHGSHWLPSDTNPFLYLVARMQGPTPDQEPNVVATVLYRLSHPVYAVLIYLTQQLTGDWLVAARWAALLPGIFVPAVVCLIVWQLDARWSSGVFAGILAAVSWPLIDRSVLPMPDMPFVFVSALLLLSAIALLRRPSIARAAVTGLLAGVAAATRPNGFFYIVTVAIPFALTLWQTARAKQQSDGVSRAHAAKAALLLVVLGGVFLLTARGPSWLFSPIAKGLQAPKSSLVGNLLSEPMFAKGKRYRDERVYSLNHDCTELNFTVSQQPLSLSEQLRRYGKDHLLAVAHNFKTLLVHTIPRILQPMALLFLPLALGLLWVIRHRPFSEILLLTLFLFPFLCIIPLLELHDNYILPITVVAVPLAGIGLTRLCSDSELLPNVQRRTLSAAAILLVTTIAGFGAYEAALQYRRADKTVTYRQSAQWIKDKHGDKFDFAVMSRYHGMYAYLKCTKTSLPVDTLDRVARYCRHTNTRYIVVGPEELEHNEDLRKALAEKEVIEVPDATFKVVATFNAPWNEPVRLVEVFGAATMPDAKK